MKMIEVKDKVMETLLRKAHKRATETNEDQLIAYTKKIDPISPLHFFEAAKELYHQRAFWMSSIDDYTIVGIGEANEIIAKNESRYEATETKWKQMIDGAIIHNPYRVKGTGVVAIGGMTFDPERQKSSLWKNYEHSQFTIPAFTLTKNKEDYYLTITTTVGKHDQYQTLAKNMLQREEQLLKYEPKKLNRIEILHEEEIKPSDWLETVRLAREKIRHNQANKIVLAREVRLTFNNEAEMTPILDSLMKNQPHCYIFAFERHGDCFIGATPERLVKVSKDKLLSTCLAGTAPRGKTFVEDEKISKDLLQDQKNLEEHEYVVQMITNSIAPYCSHIDIPDHPIVHRLKNLHHLYTPVKATFKENYHVLDIVKQLHPTPALGGVPREKSLLFIREHELLDRGWYGAPIGWMDSEDHAEFAVAIRSGLIQGKEASLFAGVGVMKDSDLQLEYEETKMKLLPMLSAIKGEN